MSAYTVSVPTYGHTYVCIHLCALYCAVLMLLFVRTSISVSPPAAEAPSEHDCSGTQDTEGARYGQTDSQHQYDRDCFELKTRLEGVKQEWELVSSQLPLHIAELEYKRNVQVRTWSRRREVATLQSL